MAQTAYQKQYAIDNKEKIKVYHQRWYRENKEKMKISNRNKELKRKFGITLEEYEELNKAQGGKCAICGSGCVTGKALAVDHNHNTGVVRGLLCSKCNTGIGLLNDDTQILLNAISYLQEND